MQIPSRRQRLVGVPLLVIALALMFVYTDILLARRDLDIIFILLAVYFACEILFWTRSRRHTRK